MKYIIDNISYSEAEAKIIAKYNKEIVTEIWDKGVCIASEKLSTIFNT